VDPIAHLDKAVVSRGGRLVLSDIDLNLGSGDVLGVAGPNGSGKTTLVRTLATLVPIDRGSGSVLGKPVGAADSVRREIGLIGHHPALIPELTIHENLSHIARLRGIDTTRVPGALEVVGLGDAAGLRVEACSFGMKRRVEIAHHLLSKPRLLLLDEAASGLDEAARALIGALVDSVRARDGATLVVSHDRSHLETLCTEVLALESGRLVAR
jgi:ABC-type multidrug transport system ATPase subunit